MRDALETLLVAAFLMWMRAEVKSLVGRAFLSLAVAFLVVAAYGEFRRDPHSQAVVDAFIETVRSWAGTFFPPAMVLLMLFLAMALKGTSRAWKVGAAVVYVAILLVRYLNGGLPI